MEQVAEQSNKILSITTYAIEKYTWASKPGLHFEENPPVKPTAGAGGAGSDERGQPGRPPQPEGGWWNDGEQVAHAVSS